MNNNEYRKLKRATQLIAVIYFAGALVLWCWLGAASLALLLPIALAIVVTTQLGIYKRLDRDQKHLRSDTLQQTQALHAIHRLLPLRHPLPAMGRYTIDPDLAELLVSLVLEHRPARVLELGSGVSTLIVGYALQAAGGGAVTSLDESDTYAQITRQHLKQHALDNTAHVVHAPLIDTKVGDQTYRWYDRASLAASNAIDLLIVDGPSGRTGPLARLPALPLLWSQLSERAVIVLDDADREDEKTIVARWCEQYPALRVRLVATRKGACVLLRSPI